MEARLRLISKRITWFLAVKSLLFTAAWLVLPFWAFFLAALYLFLSPPFRAWRFLFIFFLLLAIAWVAPPVPWMAAYLGILFFITVGIKNLIFIKRIPAYEILALLLYFLLFLGFFFRFESGEAVYVLPAALLLGFIVYILMNGYVRFRFEETGMADVRERKVFTALAAALTAEFACVLVFLPLNFLYQSVLLFLVAFLCFEIASGYLARTLDRNQVLMYGSFSFACIAVILTAAQWGL